jgi:hypothetical protein
VRGGTEIKNRDKNNNCCFVSKYDDIRENMHPTLVEKRPSIPVCKAH